jgi:hypothetical protein
VKFLPVCFVALLAASSSFATAKPTSSTRRAKPSSVAKTIAPLPPALAEDDPALVIPTLIFEPPTAAEVAEDFKQHPEIPAKFLPAYFAERPSSYLVDPQALLSPTDYQARLASLDYHASDSTIDLFVYILAGDQEIPSDIHEEELIERFFSTGRPATLIFYYLGAPQRSAVYLSPILADTVSPAEQRQMLESGIIQALEMTTPSEQFEKFLVQTFRRTYSLERLISGEASAPQTLLTTTLPTSLSKRRPLPSAKFQHAKDLAIRYAEPAAILLGVCLALILLGHWLRHRACYRFPEFEVEPRLGGSHAAGIGAVISFTSAAIPPASQRSQVPDYLRRA